MRNYRFMLALILVLPFCTDAFAQSIDPLEILANQEIPTEGWHAFLDYKFLLRFSLSLTLAIFLSAWIAYHPRRQGKSESLEAIEASKIYIMYALVGAVIGAMVVKYGIVIGFVVFGIGGIMRFRTDVGPPTKTGRVILVTLIGLSCGLNLPHIAVISSIFGYVLIFLMGRSVTFRLEVQGINEDAYAKSIEHYRRVIESLGGRILHTKKKSRKGEFILIGNVPHKVELNELEQRFSSTIPANFLGYSDIEIA